ncbi:carboxymuconolactone decarboxylase family protein [Amycolatopsis sp. VS8301801F10]|uniref:carboxymuconolactone decarboxylase family protein n=1 Tax=Amycolatopsis sp. VS8301801F10 TaxID=2652442 RepID=UPI0038FC795E
MSLLDRALLAALRRAPSRVRHGLAGRPGPGPAGEVRRQMERDFGLFAPPIALHASSPPVLAAAWAMLRETLLHGSVPRPVKETLATEISAANSCPYCVEVHGTVLSAVTGGQPGAGPVAEWARASVRRDTARSAALPGTAAQAPEFLGVAVTFHYLNRMVNVFLEASPLPPSARAGLREGALRALGRSLAGPATAPCRPGEATALLPPAALPGDLAWAAPNPVLADAFARVAAAMEAAGERSVPEPVRAVVLERLREWDGAPPGLGAELFARLPAEHEAAGRLALLTAFAPYRIDDGLVARFRATRGTTAALAELTAWAAFAAARTAGSWSAPEEMPGGARR